MMLLLAALLATPAPKPVTAASIVPVASPTPRAAVASRARAFFDQIQKNAIDRSLLTPQFSAELRPEIAATLARTLAVLGEPTAFAQRGKHDVDGVTTYDYVATFATGALTVTVGIDDTSDLIARYYVRRTPT